ncbi:MAG: hypothetical protein RPS47_00270 [Colwellia sp.]|jgi:hypothetical protein
MQRHLILTVDYELFGNGSGDIVNCVIKPTEIMLNIADKYNAKLTLFVDIAEFLAMKKSKEHQDDVGLVYTQIQNAVRRGHDVQLHLHPQWIGASYSDGSWNLALRKWRIADVDSNDMAACFGLYKQALEEIVQVVNPAYRCDVFRAGGWCIQPSAKVLTAMKAAGLRMDSTVAPGARLKNTKHWFDFSTTPKKPVWLIDNDVCAESKEGALLEVPIATIKAGYVKQVYRLLKNKISVGTSLACGCQGSYESGGSVVEKISAFYSKLINLDNIMLDFSTVPCDLMLDITASVSRNSAGYQVIPVVAISHCKNFNHISALEFERYLEVASMDKSITFSTYNEFYDLYEE